MNTSNRWYSALAVVATAWSLVACGGGGGGSSTTATPIPVVPVPPVVSSPPPSETGTPASVGNIAVDGRNWINFRRGQALMPAVAQNVLIDKAAQAHSDYQKLNNTIAHEEVVGKPGFTGVGPLERLNAAGFVFGQSNYAYGEVISATANNSGFYMAEELITAIYHRFVIFEPMFKEIGTGSATTSAGYTYFTSDFAANNGFGTGIGHGMVVTWPYSGQTSVAPNFFSDYEAPDPIPNANEVGYPVSVHADISAVLNVTSFTITRAGAVLAVKLLQHSTDAETPISAAAIIPLSPLAAATTYVVTFIGTADGIPVNKSWSFTTK
jgi:uncharacterized protein YkwD